VEIDKSLKNWYFSDYHSGKIDSRGRNATNVSPMDNLKPKLVTKQGAIIDIVLSVIFFFWMTTVLKKHVPWVESGETAVLIGAAYASACLTGVFWLALSLFRVTLADQILQKTESGKSNQ
jgi:hypothetical protein